MNTSAFNPEKAAAAVRTLRELLESSDAGAADAFHAAVQELAMRVPQEFLAALGTAINEFDFERALATLNEIVYANSLEESNHAGSQRKEGSAAGR
jgi:hypothetical protein